MKTTLLCLTASVLVSGCRCITPPAVDTTAPVVTLSVIFTNAAGREQTDSVTSADRRTRTVTLPIGRQRGLPFTLSVAVSDAGGVRTLGCDQTEYFEYLQPDGEPGESVNVSPVFARDFSRCARTWQQEGRVFNFRGRSTSYKFRASGTDFAGRRAEAPEVTMQWR